MENAIPRTFVKESWSPVHLPPPLLHQQPVQQDVVVVVVVVGVAGPKYLQSTVNKFPSQTKKR